MREVVYTTDANASLRFRKNATRQKNCKTHIDVELFLCQRLLD